MIKSLIVFQVLYAVLGFAYLQMQYSSDLSLSFLIGALTMLINTAGLVWAWKLIFSKKSIALATMIIIFKYVFLGYVLWRVTALTWLNSSVFVIGLASLLFSIIAALFTKNIFLNKA